MGRVPEGQGLEGALSTGEKAGGRHFPGPPQLNWSEAHRSPKRSMPFAGSSAPRHISAHLPACLAGRSRLSQVSWPSLSPTGEMSAGASSEISFLLAGTQSHPPPLPTPSAQQHCHCCRAGRGWHCSQQSEKPLLGSQRGQLRQIALCSGLR